MQYAANQNKLMEKILEKSRKSLKEIFNAKDKKNLQKLDFLKKFLKILIFEFCCIFFLNVGIVK